MPEQTAPSAAFFQRLASGLAGHRPGTERRLALVAASAVLLVVGAHSASAAANPANYATGSDPYLQNCASCHGADRRGAVGPSLVGAAFDARWRGRAEALHKFVAATMPPNAPGSLPPMVYDLITSYLLSPGAGAATTQSDGSGVSTVAPPAPPVRLPAEPQRFAAPSTEGPDDNELLHPRDGDWLSYNRDYQGQRYSPLDRINAQNAPQLVPKCIFQTGEVGSFQASPVIRAGRLYITTVHHTYAIDAASCRRLWVHEYRPKGVLYDYLPTNRGVALYKGTVIRGTLDGHLIALDSMTGTPVWDTWVADGAKGYFLSAAPIVFDGKVFIGEAGADYGVSGHIHAFDAVTGKSLWTFNVIPGDGEKGGDSWPRGSARGGGSMWTTISVDPAERSLYVSTGNPYLDFDGSQRTGDNLYTDSVVVLDADSGHLKWYVQQIPHDVRDWDTAAAPVLYSAGGRQRMAVGSKDGRLYLYDRDRHTLLLHQDLVDRENATGVLPAGQPTHVCPGGLGGVEWNGPAYDPLSAMLFVNTDDWCATITPQKPGESLPVGGTPVLDPPDKAQGWLRAFDAATGTERWHYHSNSPMLAGVTPTAGGVVLTGTGAGEFIAFESRTGRQLYSFPTGGALAAGVSTYLVGKRQFVAVASGNSSRTLWQTPGGAMVIIFGLP